MPQGETTVYDCGTQLCRTQDLSEHPTSALARMCLLMIMTPGRSRQLPGEQRFSPRTSTSEDRDSALRLLQPRQVTCWTSTSCLILLVACGASLHAALDLLVRLDGLRISQQRHCNNM